MKFILPRKWGLLFIALAVEAHAGGFMLRDQSISSMGKAFAGRSSSVEDATILYGNPAGITQFQSTVLSGTVSYVTGDIEISHAAGTYSGTNKGDMLEPALIPSFYVIEPLKNGWAVGLGIYGSFGLSTKYEDQFQGRYFGTHSKLSDATVQPTVAWQIAPDWSIAADITWNRTHGTLGMAVVNPFSPGTNDIHVEINGDDAAWGYGFGVLYTGFADTSIGLAYHSAVKFTLRGHTTITDVPVQGMLRYQGQLDLKTPDLTELSVTRSLQSNWILDATISYAGWKSFDEIHVENEGGPDLAEPQNWHDAIYYGVGISYVINSDWLVRTGYGFDNTPQPNSTRNVRLNDNDRDFFGIGLRWGDAKRKGFSADLTYMYVQQEAAKVNQTDNQGNFYSATYRNRVQNFAAQINYQF